MRILGGVGFGASVFGSGALLAAPALAADAQGFLVRTAEAQASLETGSVAMVIAGLVAAALTVGLVALSRPKAALVPVRIKARGRR